ncbi:MAG: hypothetical protein II328_01445 [Clostridia bacterium]|nr:hypothetical protein [Clostridia bacterium]
MEEQRLLQHATNTYEAMCRALTASEMKFERHDEDLTITFGMSGEDLPMDFVMMVNHKAQVVRLYSRLPMEVAEDKRVEIALATVFVNSKILNGAFDFDISTGRLSFNILTAFHNTTLADKVFVYMLGVAAGTIDRFNDRFLMLAKGMIDFQKFVELYEADE